MLLLKAQTAKIERLTAELATAQAAVTNAIKIVEQHSEWVSVKECLPPEEIKLLFEHEDYGVIIGYYREKGEFVTHDTSCNNRDPIDKFLKWCYIPISEAVDI